jgi:hypothetical protein
MTLSRAVEVNEDSSARSRVRPACVQSTEFLLVDETERVTLLDVLCSRNRGRTGTSTTLACTQCSAGDGRKRGGCVPPSDSRRSAIKADSDQFSIKGDRHARWSLRTERRKRDLAVAHCRRQASYGFDRPGQDARLRPVDRGLPNNTQLFSPPRNGQQNVVLDRPLHRLAERIAASKPDSGIVQPASREANAIMPGFSTVSGLQFYPGLRYRPSMAKKSMVSSTIFVGRPDLLELGDDVDYIEVDEALDAAAASATEITILGGFYSVEPILSLCKQVKRAKRKSCRIRIAVGLEATSAIPSTWTDMRGLRKKLLKSGFRDVVVAVVGSSPVHFHTKLFRFLNTTRPVWFIGSANPGSNRHELMVRLSGRHEALSAYVAAVFDTAVDIANPQPSAEILTLRDFFLTGLLCHKPPPPRLFTFDAFRFDAQHHQQLAEALAGSSGVSHASPKTLGFGFNLRSPLSQKDADEDLEGDGSTSGRLQIRPYSMDTVFGWWMPHAYGESVREKVAQDEAVRERRLAEIGAALRSTEGEAAVRDAFLAHITSMEDFLRTNGIDARPVSNREFRFEQFLSSRTKALNDPVTIQRHARLVTLTAMPDIWADGTAVDEFQQSFFDDLAFRAAGATLPAIVKSILSRLDDDTLGLGSEFQEALVHALVDKPWTDDDWE